MDRPDGWFEHDAALIEQGYTFLGFSTATNGMLVDRYYHYNHQSTALILTSELGATDVLVFQDPR